MLQCMGGCLRWTVFSVVALSCGGVSTKSTESDESNCPECGGASTSSHGGETSSSAPSSSGAESGGEGSGGASSSNKAGCWRPNYERFSFTGVSAEIGGELFLGAQGWLIRYDGKGFRSYPVPNDAGNPWVGAIWGLSPDDVWIMASPHIWHFDGTHLTSVLEQELSFPYVGIAGTASNDIWTMGWINNCDHCSTFTVHARHYDGESWEKPQLDFSTPPDVVASTFDGDIWVAGADFAARLDGDTWVSEPISLEFGPEAVLSGTTSDDLWLSSPSTLLHRSADGWSEVSTPITMQEVRQGEQGEVFGLGFVPESEMSDLGVYRFQDGEFLEVLTFPFEYNLRLGLFEGKPLVINPTGIRRVEGGALVEWSQAEPICKFEFPCEDPEGAEDDVPQCYD
jgi:hypothetical protein